jgi:hypothetical protein
MLDMLSSRDFQVNLLAGAFIFVFDVALITLLLPLILRRIEERKYLSSQGSLATKILDVSHDLSFRLYNAAFILDLALDNAIAEISARVDVTTSEDLYSEDLLNEFLASSRYVGKIAGDIEDLLSYIGLFSFAINSRYADRFSQIVNYLLETRRSSLILSGLMDGLFRCSSGFGARILSFEAHDLDAKVTKLQYEASRFVSETSARDPRLSPKPSHTRTLAEVLSAVAGNSQVVLKVFKNEQFAEWNDLYPEPKMSTDKSSAEDYQLRQDDPQ